MYKKFSICLATLAILTGCSRNMLPNASSIGINNSYSDFALKTTDKNDTSTVSTSAVSNTASLNGSDSNAPVTLSKQELQNRELYNSPDNITNYTDNDIKNGVRRLDNTNDITGPNYVPSIKRNNNKVVGVNTWDDQLTLKEDEAKKVDAYASFQDGTSVDSLNWKSSDESVAKVDSDGTVHAVAEGDATITATSTDDFSRKKEIPVTVEDN